MAIADFFDRAATAASQVLSGYDPDAFRGRLEARTVGVAFDESAARSREGQTTLELTVNLLARLYPKLALVPLDRAARPAVGLLEGLARGINPAIGLPRGLRKADPCVVVGRTAAAAPGEVICVGSDGWVAALSAAGPVGSGGSVNPFGAAAAACFAAANVFRAVFRDQLPKGARDESLRLSLLDYRQGDAAAAGPSLPDVDLGRTQLVGAGAIGNGFLWTLARMPGLTGVLEAIDHESVELSNLQRYVLTTRDDVGAPKVELAARSFEGQGFELRPVPKTWGRYLADGGDFRLERVAAALDSAEGRIAVQAALPRRVLNAWTQTGDLGVSRHDFRGEEACLACLYLPDGKRPDDDQVIADALGLPGEKESVIRPLLFYNRPVPAELLERAAAALGVPAAPLLAYAGTPIRRFYAEAICGGAVFDLTGGARGGRALVPMAFQSALAGVVLAAEVVIDAGGLRGESPGTKTTVDLLRPLGRHLSAIRKRDPDRRCLCADEDFVAVLDEKWPREECGRHGLPNGTGSPSSASAVR